MKTAYITLIMTLLMVVAGNLMADEYYVSPSGSDSNPGTLSQPFKTIARAQKAVRGSADLRKKPITVYLKEGTYTLDNTIVFTAEDSGAPGAEVRYAAVKGEKVVISGGAKLALEWTPYQNNILQAKTPAGLKMDQLFVNGNRQNMARYPNYDAKNKPYNGFAANSFSPERAKNWKDPAGGFIHAMHKSSWGGYHYVITGKDANHVVSYEGGWQNNRPMGMHAQYRFVENIFEELDAPGEWFHDAKAGILYFYPPKDIDVKTAAFEAVRLAHLIEYKGTQKNPVRHINLAELTLRHALRTFMENKEPLLRSDWTIYRGGAVLLTGAEDCLIADCEFDQVGGNAIFVNKYNRRVTVRGTHIHGAGASAVCFVGSRDSVRNPLLKYEQTLSYDQIDKTPGPKTDDYPKDCVVEDCLIHDIGVVEKQAAGVQISMAQGITVRHCSIYDTSRAGINISEGTFGGHLIEFCDVFDTVLETSDHGSFNSWGRDRYWNLRNAPEGELLQLSLLDNVEKTIIRNSRWRCDHGWDVDLDDGSSNYEIYNNVFLNGGLKLREGFHRIAYNNIGVTCGLHKHVWYKNSNDIVKNNIWMAPHNSVRCGNGKEIDYNLFAFGKSSKKGGKKGGKSGGTQSTANRGIDANSVWGDPMFVNPAKGDYRVQEGSPALKLGFKNFPMDQFGVQKPELKKIARTPKLPDIGTTKAAQPEPPAKQGKWLGATVEEITGEAFSAFGVSKEDGGIHLIEVPAGSAAAKAGFKDGDVVQRIDGQQVKTVADLQKETQLKTGKAMKVTLVREQAEMTLTIK